MSYLKQDRSKEIVIAVSLVLGALAFRLWRLGYQSFWMDEAFGVWLSSHSIPEIFRILERDSHPPLFYLLLHGWMSAGHGDAFLRFPFAVVGALNAALIYALGKRMIGRKPALLAGGFWALSFSALYADTQVRMYALAVFFSLVATIVFFEAVSRPSRLKWICYFLFASLAVFIHYYTGFVVFVHGMGLAVRKQWRVMFGLIFAFCLLFIPWSVRFFEQVLVRRTFFSGIGWREALTFSGLLGTYDLFHTTSWNIVITLLAFYIFLRGACDARLGRRERMFLVMMFLVTFLFPILLSATTPAHVYLFRCAIIFAPYFLILFFAGLCRLPNHVSFPLMGGLVLVNLYMWMLFNTGPGFERQNWRSAASALRSRLHSGDAVLVETFMSYFPLWYYLPGSFTLTYLPGQYAFEIRPSDGRNISWFPVSGQTSETQLREISTHARREWLLICQGNFDDPAAKVPKWFATHQQMIFQVHFPSLDGEQDIRIFLFDALEG